MHALHMLLPSYTYPSQIYRGFAFLHWIFRNFHFWNLLFYLSASVFSWRMPYCFHIQRFPLTPPHIKWLLQSFFSFFILYIYSYFHLPIVSPCCFQFCSSNSINVPYVFFCFNSFFDIDIYYHLIPLLIFHQKSAKKISWNLWFFQKFQDISGPGGSWTRVRKPIHSSISHHSHYINIPSMRHLMTGSSL